MMMMMMMENSEPVLLFSDNMEFYVWLGLM